VDWYLPLKLVHVISAIVAVGTNVTYFVWLAAMKERPPAEQSFALDTIKKLDSRLANPSYGVLPLTGVIMILVSDGLYEFTTTWILVAIGLYVLVGVFGGALFAPSLRRQAELVATDASGSVRLRSRGSAHAHDRSPHDAARRRDPLPDGDEAHPVGEVRSGHASWASNSCRRGRSRRRRG
jgi:uncharacterized membrane protein